MNDETKRPETQEFSLEEIVRALVPTRQFHTGAWRLGVKLRFSALSVGWMDKEERPAILPTGMLGVEAIVLTPATEPGPLVFEVAAASETEPARVTRVSTFTPTLPAPNAPHAAPRKPTRAAPSQKPKPKPKPKTKSNA